MGIAPLLLSHHHQILSSGSKIQLRDITGCDNWILLQIARISELHHNRTQAFQLGQPGSPHLELVTNDIDFMIKSGLAHVSSESSSSISTTTEIPPTLVTRMYAHMAAVYLHLVTNGFQNLEILHTTIVSAMTILQTQISAQHLSKLITPLYFIGIVSRPEHQRFFRDTCVSLMLVTPFLSHRGHILPLLEKTWARRSDPGFAWTNCAKLAKDILLI